MLKRFKLKIKILLLKIKLIYIKGKIKGLQRWI
jgi:hypothetical protein